MNAMGQGFDTTYYPDKTKVGLYQKALWRNTTHLGGFIEGSLNSKKKEAALSN